MNKIKNWFLKFKEPIHSKDMKRFILEGFLSSLLMGALLGIGSFYLSRTNLYFLTFFTFIFFYPFVTQRLYRSFSFYHVLYSVLAVFFIMFGIYVMSATELLMRGFEITGSIYLPAFNPIYHFPFLTSWSADILIIMSNIISIFVYILVCAFAYIRMKR